MNRRVLLQELHGMHPVRADEAKRVLIDGLINGSVHEEKYVCVNDGACVWMCMYFNALAYILSYLQAYVIKSMQHVFGTPKSRWFQIKLLQMCADS